jgi:hypothetical protein
MKGYPRGFLTALVATFLVLAVTGLLLIPTALDFRFAWDVPWRLPGAQRLQVATLHSAAAFAICGLAGALWSVHMRAHWRGRRHLRSGLWTAGMLGGTAVSALGVLYLGDERCLVSASAAHIVLGALVIAGLGVHWSIARLRRARQWPIARHCRGHAKI